MKKKLIFHIGHPKTGTSFLQSILSLNRDRMISEGIYYPEHVNKGHDELTKKGIAGIGNGIILLDNPSTPNIGLFNYFSDRNINELMNNQYSTIVLSSELFYRFFLTQKNYLSLLSKKFDLEIVLYIRDVIEHRISQWSQFIKAQGETRDLESFCKEKPYDIIHLNLAWIKLSKKIPFKLNIRNYCKHKKNLAYDFFVDVLKKQTLYNDIILPERHVNRSASLLEIDLQRIFNSAYGRQSSNIIFDVLRNKYNNTKPYKPTISENLYNYILSENLRDLNELNSLIPNSMHIGIGKKEDWVNKEKKSETINNEICTLLGNNIYKHLQLRNDITIRDSNKKEITMNIEKQALILYDIWKYLRDTNNENNVMPNKWLDWDSESNIVNQILTLMKIVEKNKPNDISIKNTIKELSNYVQKHCK